MATRKCTTLLFALIFMSVPGWCQSSTLTATDFGFQCGTSKSTNCPNETWPTTLAQPGLIRLWDSQVHWSALNPGSGTYDWQVLDSWLDSIAAHQPRAVIYTFGWTPCWDTTGTCVSNGSTWPTTGSTFPPGDLTFTGSQGSPSFNTFVTALVKHCSPAGNCVKDIIKYWEMWNEANSTNHWSGTIAQLYKLMAPAVTIIRANVTGAEVLTPPVAGGEPEGNAWMQTWLDTENSSGRLSDIYALHVYLRSATPETRYNVVAKTVAVKNNTAGWATTPWWDSETNFDPVTFTCGGSYAPTDCTGQIVRWQLLHNSNGAANLSWYYWNTTIGHNTQNDTAYYYMMQWLVGGEFTGVCQAASGTWTCPFTESSGTGALFVWSPSGNKPYKVPNGYVDYKDLNGGTTNVTGGENITIGVEPIMLELRRRSDG